MTNGTAVREARPSDATAFANSQVEAWRAAYAGILDAGTGELQALNLLPAFWSRGLGSQLFLASVAGLRSMGYATAYLWVADGNLRAVDFYERHGWELDGGTKHDTRFSPPLLELRMSAPLG